MPGNFRVLGKLEYDQLLAYYREYGERHTEAAYSVKPKRLDPRTAKKAWLEGWPQLGGAFRPISVVLREERAMAPMGTPRPPATPEQAAISASPAAVAHVERKLQAVRLRINGLTYDQIAQALGIEKPNAWKMVGEALLEAEAETSEDAGKAKALDLARLDKMLFKLMPKTDNPRAADTVLRVLERRARLLGLDAPTKIEASIIGKDLTDEQRAARIEEILEAGRARRAARDQTIETTAQPPVLKMLAGGAGAGPEGKP